MIEKQPWKAHQGWADESLNEGCTGNYPHWCEVTGATNPDGDPCSINGHFGIGIARLISAAPELLVALCSLLQAAENEHTATHGQLESARAAIAKATTPQ